MAKKKRRPKPSPTTRGVGRQKGPQKSIEISGGRSIRPTGDVVNKKGKQILGRRRDT